LPTKKSHITSFAEIAVDEDSPRCFVPPGQEWPPVSVTQSWTLTLA
jgi:hypothetical protein